MFSFKAICVSAVNGAIRALGHLHDPFTVSAAIIAVCSVVFLAVKMHELADRSYKPEERTV